MLCWFSIANSRPHSTTPSLPACPIVIPLQIYPCCWLYVAHSWHIVSRRPYRPSGKTKEQSALAVKIFCLFFFEFCRLFFRTVSYGNNRNKHTRASLHASTRCCCLPQPRFITPLPPCCCCCYSPLLPRPQTTWIFRWNCGSSSRRLTCRFSRPLRPPCSRFPRRTSTSPLRPSTSTPSEWNSRIFGLQIRWCGSDKPKPVSAVPTSPFPEQNWCTVLCKEQEHENTLLG